MRVLLIKPKHIGDSLVLTPTVVAIKAAYPAAEIWVVVRRGCEGILEGCPEIHRVLTVAAVDRSERRPGDFWRAIGMMTRLLGVRFDYVFELGDGHRGRLLARLARTRHRYSVKPSTPLKIREAAAFHGISSFEWKTCHRVEKDYRSVAEFLPLPAEIPPLRFAPERMEAWTPGAALENFCVMQIGTRQGFNRWHREGWRDVARALRERCSHVVLTCGPVAFEQKETAWLARELGPGVIDTQGRLSWAQLAGLLARARLYVGLNTAAMHLAAACRCPAVVLFSSTFEGNWRPWQSPHRIVAEGDLTPSGDAHADFLRASRRKMSGISAEQVVAACDEMLAATSTAISPQKLNINP